jgi:hypothetical protein
MYMPLSATQGEKWFEDMLRVGGAYKTKWRTTEGAKFL